VYTLTLLVVASAVTWLFRLDPELARGLAGVSLTFVVYGALTPLLAPLGVRAIDPWLRRAEESMLGTTLVQLVEPTTSPLLTSFFTLVYGIHVPLFLVPAYFHWRAGRRARAERLLLTLALAMYVGFVGYALFPAYGPVGTMDGLRPIGTNAGTELVATYGVALGTFPSLHAGISAAVAIDGWRTSRRWGLVYTAIAALIWASTIYLRYHWLLDLVAGLALAAACTWLAGRVQARWPRIVLVWPAPERRPVIGAAEAGAGD
jgi:membrane-associated phospholipid phosphatase